MTVINGDGQEFAVIRPVWLAKNAVLHQRFYWQDSPGKTDCCIECIDTANGRFWIVQEISDGIAVWCEINMVASGSGQLDDGNTIGRVGLWREIEHLDVGCRLGGRQIGYGLGIVVVNIDHMRIIQAVADGLRNFDHFPIIKNQPCGGHGRHRRDECIGGNHCFRGW